MRIILLTLGLSLANGLQLPAALKRCKVPPELDFKPNECLREAIEAGLKYICDNDGLKEFGMGDLDPFEINEITYATSNGPLSVALNVTEGKLFGMTKVKLSEVSGKLSSPKDFQISIKYKMDKVSMSGIYDVSGRVLVLPIVGKGFGNITFIKYSGEYTLYGQPKIKNGKEYLKITDFKSDFNVERIKFYLDNLFNGNQQLTEVMNKVLNDNWEDFYQVVKPTSVKVFGALYQKYSKKLLEKVAFEDLFITS